MQYIKRIAMITLAIAVNVAAYFVLPVILTITLVATLAAFYYIWPTFSKEYEYTYTDGSIDIDVIYGKSQRRHLITADAKEFRFIVPADDRARRVQIEAKYDKQIDATSGVPNDHVYVGLITRDERTCKVIFEPNDAMIEALQEYIPNKFKARGAKTGYGN